MRIAILTQPLKNNYGGLLQAYALQKVLKDMGHEVWTVDRPFKTKKIKRLLSICKRLILHYLFQKNVLILASPTVKEEKIIAQHTNRFINEYILRTEKINSKNKFSQLKKYDFDAYIVGSDQVWRMEYTPGMGAFFLDFVSKRTNIKRIAYAASFGVDQWEFSTKLTKRYTHLAKKFDSISVREDSAVTLCKENLECDTVQLIDPTLLLEQKDYLQLVERDSIPKKKGIVMSYVLDRTTEKNIIIKKVSSYLNLTPLFIMPEKNFSEVGIKAINHCVFPPVTKWLRGFIDADFVVTDSFHGTVFSVIFNIPFITIGNHDRGLTRFTSFLKLFGLQSRLILSASDLTSKIMDEKINFEQVNQIRKKEQQKAFSFLLNKLTSHHENVS